MSSYLTSFGFSRIACDFLTIILDCREKTLIRIRVKETCTEGRRRLLKTTCFRPNYMHVNTSETLRFSEGQFWNDFCLNSHVSCM
jgi:hypothetical protein